MNRVAKEWLGLSVFIVLVGILAIYVKSLNEGSFWEVSKITYAVKSEVANLRAGASTGHKVVHQMKQFEIVELKSRPGKWSQVKHLKSGKVGWVHKVTLGRYLSLGYYKEKIIGKSVLELVWP